MISRKKLIATATGGALTAALVAGGVAWAGGAGGAGGDRAADLAAALNKRAGTSITADQVKGAFQDLLKARLDADVAAGRLTQAQEDQILARAANGLPPFGGPGGPWGPGGPDHHRGPEAVLTKAAAALSMTPDALETQLRSGKTLAQVAASKGVARDILLAAVVAGIKADRPDISDADATTFANRIVDGKGRPGPGPGAWHRGPRGGGGLYGP